MSYNHDNLRKEAEQFIELQQWLYNITDSNFEETKSNIEASIFIINPKYCSKFIRSVICTVYNRPLLCNILIKLFNSLKSPILAKKLLDFYFLHQHDQYLIYENARDCYFLRQCLTAGFVSADEILIQIESYSKKFSKKSQYSASLFLYFAPEIRDNSPDFFQQMMNEYSPDSNRSSTIAIDFFNKYREDPDECMQSIRNMEADPVHEALMNDNCDFIQEIEIDYNYRIRPSLFSPSSFLQYEPTIIQVAAFYGALKCFKFLMLNGASLLSCDNSNHCLLDFAIAGGNLEIVHILESGITEQSMVMANRFHQTDITIWLNETKGINLSLEGCLTSSNFEVALMCLDSGVDDLEIVRFPYSAVDLYLFFVKSGREIDMRSAITVFSLKAIKILCKPENINDLIIEAIRAGYIEAFDYLFDKYEGDVGEILLFSLKMYEYDITRKILESGKKLDGSKCEESLIKACCDNQYDVVRILLEKGISPNCVDSVGWTPLHIALNESYVEIAELLVQQPSIDINIQCSEGWTPLHVAVETRDLDLMKLLIETGKADLYIKNNNGKSPYETAMDTDDIEIQFYFTMLD